MKKAAKRAERRQKKKEKKARKKIKRARAKRAKRERRASRRLARREKRLGRARERAYRRDYGPFLRRAMKSLDAEIDALWTVLRLYSTTDNAVIFPPFSSELQTGEYVGASSSDNAQECSSRHSVSSEEENIACPVVPPRALEVAQEDIDSLEQSHMTRCIFGFPGCRGRRGTRHTKKCNEKNKAGLKCARYGYPGCSGGAGRKHSKRCREKNLSQPADASTNTSDSTLTLRSIHAYKLGELKTLAEEHNISTTKQGKKKTIPRTKGELYAELKKFG